MKIEGKEKKKQKRLFKLKSFDITMSAYMRPSDRKYLQIIIENHLIHCNFIVVDVSCSTPTEMRIFQNTIF